MTNMKDSVRCTNCKSCIAGQQRSVRASAKNSGKTWKDCGRAASKTSSKSNFGEGCSAEISEVRNVRKGRARLCKAMQGYARLARLAFVGEMKARRSRWREIWGDGKHMQTACSVERKPSKYPDMSRYISMQLQDSLPTYQYTIEMSAGYWKVKQSANCKLDLFCKDLWCSLDLEL